MASTTLVLSLKLLLISTALVSIAVLIKMSLPFVTHLLCHDIPVVWSCLTSLLRPPYLYFVINAIIVIIAVTSRCHDVGGETGRSEPLVSRSDDAAAYEVEKNVVVNDDVAVREEDEDTALGSVWTPPQRSKSLERLPEKPSVSTSFVGGPKGGKSSKSKQNDTIENTWKTIAEARPIHITKCDTTENQDGPIISTVNINTKPLSVKKSATFRDRTNRCALIIGGKSSKSKQNDTIENTWKTIAEARSIHITKCDTTENQDGPIISTVNINTKPLSVKKLATFRDRTNYDPMVSNTSPSTIKFRKEPSLSQDELNNRVEAFIRKFQDEMRLQRQESLNQYMDMIKRSAH